MGQSNMYYTEEGVSTALLFFLTLQST